MRQSLPHGGGVSSEVCAGEGDHAAGLPLGARLLSQGAHGAVLPTRSTYFVQQTPPPPK
jgi:hypothetical protein